MENTAFALSSPCMSEICVTALFCHFRIFPIPITWLWEVSASPGTPQFGQMATGLPHYSQ